MMWADEFQILLSVLIAVTGMEHTRKYSPSLYVEVNIVFMDNLEFTYFHCKANVCIH